MGATSAYSLLLQPRAGKGKPLPGPRMHTWLCLVAAPDF